VCGTAGHVSETHSVWGLFHLDLVYHPLAGYAAGTMLAGNRSSVEWRRNGRRIPAKQNLLQKVSAVPITHHSHCVQITHFGDLRLIPARMNDSANYECRIDGKCVRVCVCECAPERVHH
jgi:hypothetical protein